MYAISGLSATPCYKCNFCLSGTQRLCAWCPEMDRCSLVTCQQVVQVAFARPPSGCSWPSRKTSAAIGFEGWTRRTFCSGCAECIRSWLRGTLGGFHVLTDGTVAFRHGSCKPPHSATPCVSLQQGGRRPKNESPLRSLRFQGRSY